MNTLTRPCVLLVEDNLDLAQMMKEQLLESGYEVLDTARVEEALHLVQTQQIHTAILDVNIGGEKVFPVAELLHQHGIPFVFASSDRASVPSHHAERPFIEKPYQVGDVVGQIGTIIIGPLEQPPRQ